MARQRAQLLAIHPEHPEPRRIQQAVKLLSDARAIVYPTDTIYGIGADSGSRAAIDRVYALRKLDLKKPLSLVCASISEASRYAIISDECHRAMRRLLPGPYTFVLRATREAPKVGDQKRRTVGIRIPDSPVARALAEALGRPLISASAIIDAAQLETWGKRSAQRREAERSQEGEFTSPITWSDPVELADHYGAEGVAMVLDAGPLAGTPSSIVDWTEDTPRIVREGAGDVSSLQDG